VNKNLHYRPDVDGLRALAVLPVIFYHAGFGLFSGGFVGVDVFFVISGFLITSIIQPQVQAGRFSLLTFYQRRIWRILPALFLILFFCSIGAYFLMPPQSLEIFAKNLIATVVFSSNFFFKAHTGYFDAPAETYPLLHTWSLAIEEQFYIFYPLLLAAVARKNRSLKKILLPLALLSFGACLWMTSASVSSAFYLLPFRAWELLFGGLLALGVLPPPRSWKWKEAVAVSGIVLIALGVFGVSKQDAFPGWRALLPCLGAALVIYAGQAREFNSRFGVERWLGSRPLVFVGLISYSLYLWHWPALVFARMFKLGTLSLPGTVWTLAGVTVASVLSWKFVESPFREFNRRPPKKALIFALTGMLTFFAVGQLALFKRGWPERLPKAAQRIQTESENFNPRRKECHGDPIPPPAELKDHCVYGAAVEPAYAVWGDSFAAEIAWQMGRWMIAKNKAVLHVSYSSCPPAALPFLELPPNCLEANRRALKELRERREVEIVFLVARYDAYATNWLEGLEEVVRELHTAGKKAVIIYPVPEAHEPVPAQLARALWRDQSFEKTYPSRAEFEAKNREIIARLDQIRRDTGAEALAPAAILCGEVLCQTQADGHALYFDKTHLSLYGVEFLRPLFEKFL
jgi:peptidoglycan/LPS O-acetylase OafA/YrhL